MSKSLLAQLMEKAETITDLDPKETELTIDRKVIVQLVKTPRISCFQQPNYETDGFENVNSNSSST